jgi:predicted phage-related endonuclease
MMRRIDEGDPPAASAGDSDVLAAAFAEPTPGAHVELPPGARYVLDDLDAAKARAKRAKADVDRDTNQLRVWLGDAEVGMLDGDEPVTWKGHDVTRLDSKRLRDERPDVFDAYATTTIERRLVARSRKE